MSKIYGWADKVVIHCSVHSARKGNNWYIVEDKYEGQCVFVGTEEEYKAFDYKAEFYKPKNLYEHFQIINSCKFFIGNQSMPLAAAHSLGVNRLAMLNETDKIAYMGEEKWHKNFYWMTDKEHFFEGINY